MDENFSDIVSDCNEAQNEYKKLRHGKAVVLLSVQWCETYGFKTHEKYEHFVEKKMRKRK